MFCLLFGAFDAVLLNQHGIKITRKVIITSLAFFIRQKTLGELQMPYDSHTDFEQLKIPSQASETKEALVHPPTSQFGVNRGEVPYL